MSEANSPANVSATPQISPEQLLEGLRQTSMMKCIIWSVVLHVVIIGLSSIGYIAAGFRDPAEVAAEAEAAKKAAEVAAADAKKNGTQEGAPGAGNTQPAVGNAQPAVGNTQPATGETKPTKPLSAIEQAISSQPKPEEIQREPDKNINLKFDDGL